MNDIIILELPTSVCGLGCAEGKSLCWNTHPVAARTGFLTTDQVPPVTLGK
jgi:hypothetical protein